MVHVNGHVPRSATQKSPNIFQLSARPLRRWLNASSKELHGTFGDQSAPSVLLGDSHTSRPDQFPHIAQTASVRPRVPVLANAKDEQTEAGEI